MRLRWIRISRVVGWVSCREAFESLFTSEDGVALDLQALSGGQPVDAILLDLMMYDDDAIFRAAFRLFNRRYGQQRKLLTAVREVIWPIDGTVRSRGGHREREREREREKRHTKTTMNRVRPARHTIGDGPLDPTLTVVVRPTGCVCSVAMMSGRAAHRLVRADLRRHGQDGVGARLPPLPPPLDRGPSAGI